MFSLIPPPFKQYIEAGLVLAIAVAAGLFYWHYEWLVSRSVLADTYEKQISAEHELADRLADLGARVDKNRTDFDNRLSQWEGTQSDVLSGIMRGIGKTPAATLVVCRPSDSDRRLFNDGAARLLGTPADPGSAPLPVAPGPTH